MLNNQPANSETVVYQRGQEVDVSKIFDEVLRDVLREQLEKDIKRLLANPQRQVAKREAVKKTQKKPAVTRGIGFALRGLFGLPFTLLSEFLRTMVHGSPFQSTSGKRKTFHWHGLYCKVCQKKRYCAA